MPETQSLPPQTLPPGFLPEVADSVAPISQMVALCANAAPEAIAVEAGGVTLTYSELDARANQLANRLVELGVGRETVVALALGRSAESVMSSLAVLKAGGAYLPLDPAYPAERLAFMLNDAQPRVLITNSEVSGNLPAGPWSVIEIGADREVDGCSTSAPVVETVKDQLAYVIYTSGSTGQPKGVEVTIENLSNLIAWHQRAFEVSAKDRASHLASVGFDAAVWEVWPYLTAGASLHLPDESTRVSPESLRDWLVANQITISFIPTALAECLMQMDWPAETALRLLLTGADTLHRYPQKGLPFEVVNNYGPTECTVVTTSGRVNSANEASGLPTIGQPIANCDVFILDENLCQVAPGAAGELYVGGLNLARGYRNRPDLTTEKFICDPFGDGQSARLYRTGDRARYLPNGEIAYLGRADEQIKILGYRIEPTEIEAAIDRHPAIASSAVVARGSNCSEKRLTAYITMRNGTIPSTAELREFLKTSLPDYMLPSIFARLDRLPLTPNGKVDRAGLPEPTIENTLRDEDFIAPCTPIETRLAKILCSLLNISEVSVNDNFFLLGGHSLLGTQLIAKIRSAFGVDMALRTLFDAPSIAELSSEIERLIFARVENMSEEEAQALLA
ncbi:MAG TPA: non-ribosomal peptide synthetase [Pyrinomonadaceae bacterium]|jgi:amino acid adenylation domain-containing protein|nr:non-ribosomal peptide synthetase [Pyrinomonadaceae bacterium]